MIIFKILNYFIKIIPIWMGMNLYFVVPIIDRKTGHRGEDGEIQSMGMKLLIYVSIFGVISFLFLDKIRRIRKDVYLVNRLEYLMMTNTHRNYENHRNEIIGLKRTIKLKNIKKIAKRNKLKKRLNPINLLKSD